MDNYSVFESASKDSYILLFKLDKDEIKLYTINLDKRDANQKHQKDPDSNSSYSDLSVVEFTKQSVTLSNNKVINLLPVDITCVFPIINSLLLSLPSLKNKCERQDELLADYKQRLGISTEGDKTSTQNAKKPSGRDLLNPRMKKAAVPAKRGAFVDQE